MKYSRMVRFSRFFLTGICLASLFGLFTARAQTRNFSAQQRVSKDVSLTHLYWHLLMWQNHLDQAAADHEKSGRDGAWLRTYLQKELGFTDDQFRPVRQTAQSLQATIAGFDAQAHAIIKQKQVLHAEGLLSSSDSSSNFPELTELTQQREGQRSTIRSLR